MRTHADVRRHMRKRLMGLATTIVIVTVIAVGVLGTAINKAAKKLPVDPYVALAGGVTPQPEPDPPQAKLGAGIDEVRSKSAILRRNLLRLRYRDERAVRRLLEEYHATGPGVDPFQVREFADEVEQALAEDERGAVRHAALAVLRRLPPGVLIDDPFAPFLTDEDAEMRRLAVLGYGARARDARWATIAELATDVDADVRVAVATIVGGVRDEVAVRVLVELLLDHDDAVVEAAGAALGLSLRRELPDRFVKAFADERASVRLAATSALCVARGRAATPILVSLLQDRDWRVRRKAMQGLACLRGPSATVAARALESVAAQVELPRTDRFEALQALAAVPELSDPDRLRKIMIDDMDPVLRLVAARAALAHNDLTALTSLLDLLSVEEGDRCDDEDRTFIRETAEATLREALSIEGPEGVRYTEEAARAKLRRLQPESLSYSPTRLSELW